LREKKLSEIRKKQAEHERQLGFERQRELEKRKRIEKDNERRMKQDLILADKAKQRLDRKQRDIRVESESRIKDER